MNPEQMAQMFKDQGIDPNSLPPEQLQALMSDMQSQGQGQPQDPNQQSGGMQVQDPNQQGQIPQDPNMMPPQDPSQGQLDPMHMLTEVTLQYMDFILGVKNDKEINSVIKGQIMTQVAQAISSLVPLLPNTQDMQMKQMEFQMKQHEMETNLQFKQKELEMNMHFKQQEMELKAHESQQKAQLDQQTNQQKIIQENEKHKLNLVQSQQAHQVSMEQQKQAAQLKQSQNQGNNQSKNNGGN